MFKYILTLVILVMVFVAGAASAHEDDAGWAVGDTLWAAGMCFAPEPLMKVADSATKQEAQALYDQAIDDGGCIDFPYTKRLTRLLAAGRVHFTIPGRKGTLTVWTIQPRGYPPGYGMIVDRKVTP